MPTTPWQSRRSLGPALGQARRWLGCALFAGGLHFGASLVGTEAFAQSAADKATARELAADGIKKFNAGDAEGARVLLEKAQALYDAPIHLLYLARAHDKLGNLVEAAESYRLLVRTKLDDDAPAVFRKAQEDGITELEKLEPRIARLTITVAPEVEGLEVTVDGKSINTAALSVPRATNPGMRKVLVEAPGYVPVEREVELTEGGENTVAIQLEEAEGEAAAAARSEGQGDSGEGAENGSSDAVTAQESGPFGFIVGVRVGGFVPLGELEPGREMSSYWQPGVSGRGELGFRFARYFGVKGYFGLGEVRPGSALNDFATRQVRALVSRNSAGITEAGAAVLATMDPRKIGGFGEIGFSFLHRYRWSQHITGGDNTVDIDCTNKATYDGFAVRAGGGMNIPLARVFTLVPAVDVTIGQLGKRTADYGCQETIGSFTIGPAADAAEEQISSALHYQIFLGLGGDFHFGDELFQ